MEDSIDATTVVSPVVSRAHDRVTSEIGRSDTKAGLLLTTVGLTVGIGVGAFGAPIPKAAKIAAWVIALAVFFAILILLRTIRPNLTADPPVGSWMDAALNGPQGLLAAREFADAAVAEDVCILGVIALVKYRRIRWAVDLLCVVVVVIAVVLAVWIFA